MSDQRSESVASDDCRNIVEREHAKLIAAYYRGEIGRLMQQAEHWAANDYPLAVHHRLRKAQAYFQIVSLFERGGAGNENPFDVMRRVVDRGAGDKPHGTYPPSKELARYYDPAFVAALPPMPSRPASPPPESGTEQAPAPVKALPPAHVEPGGST